MKYLLDLACESKRVKAIREEKEFHCRKGILGMFVFQMKRDP